MSLMEKTEFSFFLNSLFSGIALRASHLGNVTLREFHNTVEVFPRTGLSKTPLDLVLNKPCVLPSEFLNMSPG